MVHSISYRHCTTTSGHIELVSKPENEIDLAEEEPVQPATVPTVKGVMPVRPANMPATAEVDPRTGRWMINGVPVGAKLGSAGVASRDDSVRIGMDPISESKKPSDITSEPEVFNQVVSGQEASIDTQEAVEIPTKDGQS